MNLQTRDQRQVDSSTTTFDATTALVAVPLENGRFTVDLDAAWSSLVGVHGGYLAALAINAAEAFVGDRSIRTMTTAFLRRAHVGPAVLTVEQLRRGRSISNLSVTLSQESQPIAVSQVTAAKAVESTSWETIADLRLPPAEECVPITPPPEVRHFDHGEALLDPADLPFSHGPRGRGAGYVRPRQPRPIDAAWLGMALDWFPPASFSRVDPPTGGISINYSIHLHRTLPRLADNEWLGAVFVADVSVGGIALEKGIIAGPDGLVLAESFHTRLTAGPDQRIV